jgi:hypothetical protein
MAYSMTFLRAEFNSQSPQSAFRRILRESGRISALTLRPESETGISLLFGNRGFSRPKEQALVPRPV